MTVNPALEALGLPEIVGRFADEEKGLIVFSGPDDSVLRISAYALARHIWERTGRAATIIGSGPDAVELQDPQFTRLKASGQYEAMKQIGKAAEDGARVILVDCRPVTGDVMMRVVEAAAGGALVIGTLNCSDRHPYVWLIDLLWSTEDWEIRPKFDASLYAIVQQAGDKTLEADVFIPDFRR